MFLRMLIESFARRRTRKLLAVTAVWIGLSLVIGLLALGLDVGDKLNRELRSFGANIKLQPAEAAVDVRIGGFELVAPGRTVYLDEADLPRLKQIFWRNNILAFAPRLNTQTRLAERSVPLVGTWFNHRVTVEDAEPFVTGAAKVFPYWQVRGAWPKDSESCLVGSALAQELDLNPGDQLDLVTDQGSASLRIVGVLTSGNEEDRAIVAPLSVVQRLAGLPGKVAQVDIIALTTPENKLAERYGRDPQTLTPAEYERWVCTPYPGSVAADIQNAVPGSSARVVRRVAETQGAVLGRIDGLMLLLGLFVLIASTLSIMGMLSSAVLERRGEVALLQAVGAHRADVLRLFLAEAVAIGLVGGALAALTGQVLGRWLLRMIFDSASEPHGVLLILAPLLGLLIAIAASLPPVWRTVHQPAARLLRGV